MLPSPLRWQRNALLNELMPHMKHGANGGTRIRDLLIDNQAF